MCNIKKIHLSSVFSVFVENTGCDLHLSSCFFKVADWANSTKLYKKAVPRGDLVKTSKKKKKF